MRLPLFFACFFKSLLNQASFVARRAALLSSRGRARADEASLGGGQLDRDPAATSSGIVYDAQLVIIRHGKTEFNKLGLFTGWDDAPLAPEGRSEAVAAGQLLKAHGLTFDVVKVFCCPKGRSN